MVNKAIFIRVFLVAGLFSFVAAAQQRSEIKPNVLIRAYEKSRDEQAIIKILNQHPEFLRYENLGMPEGTTEKYINSSKYITRVMQENNETAGFVNFVKVDRKFWFLNFGSTGLVHLMGVDNVYQGKQYGKALLSHAVQDLLDKGVSKIFVTTKATNAKARKLYEKSGFKLLNQVGEDCYYEANFVNEKAPAPTLAGKALDYATAHPGQAGLAIAALLLGSGYGGYRGIKALVRKFRN